MTITDTNDIITGIRDHDSDIIATTLLNVCIMAADRRGGRRMLSVDDYIAFKAMLEAADGIGPVEQVQRSTQTYHERPDAIRGGVEAVAEAVGATLPPNSL